MNIQGVKLQNWLTHRRAEFTFAPMTVIAGPNASGKTSIRDAIGYAALATAYRVSTKGERVKLLSEGSDKGSVGITVGGVTVVRDIETGKIEMPQAIPIGDGAIGVALDVLLEPSAFARLAPDGRRELLLKVMRVAMTPEALIAELKARGHADAQLDRLEAMKPNVAIADWIKMAETATSEARGAWKATAGETYGTQKAAAWKAAGLDTEFPTQEQIADAAEDVAAARRSLEDLIRDLAEYDTLARSGTAMRDRTTALRQKAEHIPALTDRLAQATDACRDAEGELTEATAIYEDILGRLQPKHLDCPHCGAGVMVNPTGTELTAVRVLANPATAQQENDAYDAQKRAKEAYETLKKLEGIAQKQLAEAEAAKAELRDIGAPLSAPVGDRADIEAQIADARVLVDNAVRVHAEAEKAARTARAATESTRKAAEHHAAVLAWSKLADDLKPTGIPGDLLAKALDPFNATLRDQSAATKWPQPHIGADMAITAGGRPYGLLCESEQWRVDAQIAVALAIHSRLKCVALDRFDVLEVAARRGALGWIYGLIRRGELDTGLVIGTLKAPPEVPKDVRVIWLGPDIEQKAAA